MEKRWTWALVVIAILLVGFVGFEYTSKGEINLSPKSMRSDVNSDGVENIMDAVAMLHYLNGDKINVNLKAADFDGNKIVDMEDVYGYLEYWFITNKKVGDGEEIRGIEREEKLRLSPRLDLVCNVEFIRGDANDDELLNIADVIVILNHLFPSSADTLQCFDAGDVNDDELLNIADAVFLLGYLFPGGAPPNMIPGPFPSVGYDEEGMGAFTGPSWSFRDGEDNDDDGEVDEGEGVSTWESVFGTPSSDIAHGVHQMSDRGFFVTGYTKNIPLGVGYITLVKFDAEGNLVWNSTVDEIGYETILSSDRTADDGFILRGYSSLTGFSDNSVYLLKLDEYGGKEWAKWFGGYVDNLGFSVKQTADGGYVSVGGTTSFSVGGDSDFWIIKTNESGDTCYFGAGGECSEPGKFVKLIGGGQHDRAYSVQQTADRGYIVVGETQSFGVGLVNVFLVKMDYLGNVEWNKTYGGSGYANYAYDVQQTDDGGYVFTGKTSGGVWLVKTDEIGNVEWNKTYGGTGVHDEAKSVKQTDDGGYIIGGSTSTYAMGLVDAWLIKTNSFGDGVWNKTYGGLDVEKGNFVQQTNEGGFVLVGEGPSQHSSYSDFYILRTDSEGNV